MIKGLKGDPLTKILSQNKNLKKWACCLFFVFIIKSAEELILYSCTEVVQPLLPTLCLVV